MFHDKYESYKYEKWENCWRKTDLLIEPLSETVVGHEAKPEAADHHVAQLQDDKEV